MNLKYLVVKNNYFLKLKLKPVNTLSQEMTGKNIRKNNLIIKSTQGSYLKFSSKFFFFIVDKIQSIFLKNGKKNNLIKNLNKSIFFFYLYFISNSHSIFLDKNILNFNKNDFLFIDEFKTQLLQNSSYLNIHNILSMFLIELQPFFFLKSSLIEKKFRKKKEEKYLYKISYIEKRGRIKKSLNIFRLGFFRIKNYKFYLKFFFFFFDIFLNYKKSWIYEYKINTYKKLFLNS